MISLDGRTLELADVAAVARGDAPVRLAPSAREAVRAGQQLLERMMADGTPVYGVTTGFGALDARGVAPEANRAQQHNLLRSHAAGVGPPMSDDAVRAMMLIRANVLASGCTGARADALDALIAMLNRRVIPYVPERGSVGACGDLAPLAHMALPLIGEGRARVAGGAWTSGAQALEAAGIAPPPVVGRDGLALINGTEQTTGIGCLAAADAGRLLDVAEAVAALTLEALGALADSFDERVALAKGHPGQGAVSARLRRLTAGSESVAAPRAGRLRDALALRCIPQVLGAARDALDHVEEGLRAEINAVNDNPIFGVAEGWVTSNSGNFHGQRAGELLDYLANSLTSVAVMSERRAARLVDPHQNGGLPAFLIHPEAAAGEHCGFMLAQYTAAALVAELRTRAVAASVQSVPTCANTEDHVPMSPVAARRAAFCAECAAQVTAIELLLACQALDLRVLRPAPALRPLYEAVRARVAVMVHDRVLADDIAALAALVRSEEATASLRDAPA